MSKVSKTARASMGSGLVIKEKKVIPDEVYIKNLRIDLDSGLYVAQEGARALLRAYDSLLNDVSLKEALANKAIENEALYKNNQALDAELQAALKQVAELQAELNNIITGDPNG